MAESISRWGEMTMQCEALTRRGARCRRRTAHANRLCSVHQPRTTPSPNSDLKEQRDLPDVQDPPAKPGEADRAAIPRAIRGLGLGVLGSLVATALGKLSGLDDWLDENAGPGEAGEKELRGHGEKNSPSVLFPTALRADFSPEGLLMHWSAVMAADAYWLEWVYRKTLLSEWMRGSGPYTELPRPDHLIPFGELRSCGCKQICWKVRAVFFPPGPRREWRRGPRYGPFSETHCLEVLLGSENLAYGERWSTA